MDYEWASSMTYLHWLQSCDPLEVRGQVVIVTKKSGSGRRFMDEVGMAGKHDHPMDWFHLINK